MARLRDLPLVDAAVPATATFAEAVGRLFAASVPALAVLDEEGSLVGVFSERDALRALFPEYLGELRHTAFLRDDPAALDRRAEAVRNVPVARFARALEPLEAEESETHAAERLLHSGEHALPVCEGRRFLGMLSIAALCHTRLERRERG
ncbi:MAG TPA: CBS domain-containing protein [Gaiellaceae bacterium]|nr:CBS domain-containing protein [Gaiellaceae bacterium]